MEELNRLLTQTSRAIGSQVWFFKPRASTSEWTQTTLCQVAAGIPGVEVHVDLDGVEAKRFGAKTSGDVLLYDTEGRLVFRGGITGGRGHIGKNEAEAALLSALKVPGTSSTQWPVYGCSLISQCEPEIETGK